MVKNYTIYTISKGFFWIWFSLNCGLFIAICKWLYKIDNSKKLVDFDLYIEDITDIIAKKITFRKKDNKTRDIIDIAICLKSNPNLFNELIELEKVTKDDLKILKESLLQLNKNRYLSQLNIVKPFEKYIELSKKAPEYLISKIC